MAKMLVSDELWEMIAPLLPPEPPKPKGGPTARDGLWQWDDVLAQATGLAASRGVGQGAPQALGEAAKG